ncbi:small GTP-binding protein [Histomonas meleagridis]|uniref:small GTP-binding protein n=1 Tax=Histomonas meleagridis TaxID=135588 RepID=UPI00355964B5|nr:small GTP-binding protein [Histomonas meleagridis]KAH0807159.1 small GTP-binding protein [Histomonas meleagridis]
MASNAEIDPIFLEYTSKLEERFTSEFDRSVLPPTRSFRESVTIPIQHRPSSLIKPRGFTHRITKKDQKVSFNFPSYFIKIQSNNTEKRVDWFICSYSQFALYYSNEEIEILPPLEVVFDNNGKTLALTSDSGTQRFKVASDVSFLMAAPTSILCDFITCANASHSIPPVNSLTYFYYEPILNNYRFLLLFSHIPIQAFSVEAWFQVIVVGNTDVGKTSLIYRFVNDKFSPETYSTLAPNNFNCMATSVSGKQVELTIWDTAGQERYQAISQMFYRNSVVALICTDKESIDSIEKWKDCVHEEAPKCIIVIVITKSDLNPDENQQALEKATQIAEKINSNTPILTSALTGQGIKEVFEAVATLVEKTLLPTEESNQVEIKTNNSDRSSKCCN